MLCPCVFPWDSLGFSAFLAFQALFSLFSSFLWVLCGEEGWGQRQWELNPIPWKRMWVNPDPLTKEFSACPRTVLSLSHFQPSFPCAFFLLGANPPNPIPLEHRGGLVHPKSQRGFPGAAARGEARDGCRDRGWRGQHPAEHRFGSVEKPGLLQSPPRVAGMVLVGCGCWIRPVIN